LYCALLVVWVPLLWPTFCLKSWARGWLLIVIAAGNAALIYEIRMYLWSSANIRLDIILISIALGLLYGSAAVLLFSRHWRKAATLLTAVLVVIGGGMSYKWIEVSREGQRVSEAFEEGNRLLFNAKFRNRETYESHFGPFTGASEDYPTGHWQIEGRSRFTRVIINAKGRVWLFYQCYEDIECHSGPGGSGLRKNGNDPRQWSASLKPPVGMPFDIEITQTETDALSVKERDQRIHFTKARPPVDPAPAPQSLRFLGSFSDAECVREYAKVRQVWLWQARQRHFGVGIFSTFVAGQQSLFVRPFVIGEGVKEGDGWHFAWQQDERSGTALIALKDGDAILTLDLDVNQSGRDLEDANQLVLKAGGIFSDERIELAPLTTGADWQHWFDNVLVGQFISGDVPGC
ncbi:MAG: hypothetical protein ACR2PF_13260, partial [Rhizobiaceae bacterium]